MFEDQTFEVIMDRMLNSISADIDTREGSVIYNALAPAAAELVQVLYLARYCAGTCLLGHSTRRIFRSSGY
nr:hypothetical protein P5668_08845 [Bacillus subtilis]